MNDEAFLSKDQITTLKKTLLVGFSPEEQDFFLIRCERAKMDPFSGQIHPTRRKTKTRNKEGKEEYVEKLVPVVGIYGMIARAVRTGQYNGCEVYWCGPGGKWQTEWLEEENPAAAKAIVYVRNREKPEIAIARWISFAQTQKNYETKQYELTTFWYKMPDFMLSKVARAAALRAAFPDELEGLYIAEELHAQPELDIVTDQQEEKIADNQAREKKVVIPGAKVVEMKTEQPAPAAAAEPAFPEDATKPPAAAPRFSQELGADFPEKKGLEPQPPPPASNIEDNLDISPAPAPSQPEPEWKNHVITGIEARRFHGRKLGDLDEADRQMLEQKWLPRVQAEWDKASPAQKEEYPFIEACVAYYKMAKPWQ